MADVRIRYLVDLVDRATTRLLVQDRKIQTSLGATERLSKKLAATSKAAGSAQAAAATQAATAATRQGTASKGATAATAAHGRAAKVTATAVEQYAVAQQHALTSGAALQRTAAGQAAALRAQARAAQQAAVAQDRQAAASKRAAAVASTTATGAAAGAGAVAGRAARVGGGVAAASGVGAGLAIRTFAGYEEQLDKVQAVSGATAKQMAAMNAQAKQLGADTAFSAREAAAGMFELSTAGFTANQTMKILPGTLALASASGVELAEAAALQASSLRGFGMGAKDAGRVADVLAQTVNVSALSMSDLAVALPYVASTAKQTGTSFEETAAMAGILGNAGLEASTIGTSLRTAMLRLTDPTKKMAGRFRDMGLEAKDLAAIPLPEAVGKIAEGLKRLPTRGEKVGAVAAIFGKEAAPAMLNLLSQGEGGIDRVTKALQNSEGQAKKTAQIMRDNVAGAWDEFTGSIETASISLVERFGPAIKGALKGAAGGVNTAVRFVTGQSGAGKQARTGLAAGLAGRTGAETAGFEGVGKAAVTVGNTVRSAVQIAKGAVTDLLGALRPAAPFLQNVLLPLLVGIGKGVLAGIVGAFKVAIPIIKVVATVLGAIGRVAAPFRGVIEGIGVAIGFVFTGPILKGVALLGKLGGVFRVVGAAAKVLAVPVRLVGAVFGTLLKAAGRVVSFLGTRFLAVWVSGALAVTRLVSTIRGVAGKVFGFAKNIVSSVGKGLAGIGGRVISPFRSAFEAVFGFVRGLGGRFFRAGKGLVSRLVDGVKGIGKAIVGAFGRGIGFAADIGRAIANWLNDKTPLGDKVNLPGPLPDFRMPRLRRGGHIRRFAEGGLVPILAAGGEMLVDRGRASVIPGRDDRDGTPLWARPGSAVLTYSGQALMAAGASLSQALAAQAPHFQKGGVVGPKKIAAYGREAKFRGTRLIRAVAVALAESAGKLRAVSPTDDHGLWQINRRYHPKYFKTPGRIYEPVYNARAAYDISDGGRNWRPWTTWRTGAAQKLLDKARAAVVGSRNLKVGEGEGAREQTISVPIRLGRSRTRAGLVADAFAQGVSAGEGGLTRSEINAAVAGGRGARRNPIMEAIASAQSATRRQVTIPGVGRESDSSRGGRGRGGFRLGGGWGGTENIVRRAIRGLGRWTGKRSVAIGGNRNSDHNTWIRNAFAADIPATGERGDRIFRTIAQRIGVNARKGSWNRFVNKPIRGVRSQLLWHAPDGTHRDHVHFGVRRMRRGGIVGRFRSGGRIAGAGPALSRGVATALTFKGGSFDALDEIIGQAAEAKLEALRRHLVSRVRKGGDKKVVQRLQGMIDLVDFELGRRFGRIRDAMERRTSNIDAARTFGDLNRRARGVLPDSAAGLAEQATFESTFITPLLEANVRSAQSLVRRAQQSGNAELIETAAADLLGAQQALAEQVVTQIERWRDIVRARAQELVDAAQFSLDITQGNLAGFDAGQRLARTADTPTGMRQRASMITSTVVPSLQGLQGALWQQYNAAQSIGDTAGMRQAHLAIQQASNDIATAMADAAELVRDAALKAAQNAVDLATHRSTMADQRLRRLELEQRLVGTHDTAAGAEGRAHFIRTQIVPALQQEVTALQAQQAEAVRQGDPVLARQIAEQIAGKQNDVLQAQLDAQEQIAQNTEALQEFAGTIGYEFAGEAFTDAIVRSGA